MTKYLVQGVDRFEVEIEADSIAEARAEVEIHGVANGDYQGIEVESIEIIEGGEEE